MRGMKVAGAKVVVTGASSGIGAALAPMLAERGATVGIVARREDRLASILARCQEYAPDSRMWTADLSDAAAAEQLALQMWDELGGIDVLVNNAGAPKRRTVQEMTVAELQQTMELNFESPVRMSLAVLPRMLARNAGVIMNVTSFGGRVGIIGEAAYCASKFALTGWSESMQLDLWETGVKVKVVLPGAIQTEIWEVPDNDKALYDGPFEPAENVAAGMIDAIEDDGFEYYLPDMKPIVEMKTADVNGFLAGVIAFAKASNG